MNDGENHSSDDSLRRVVCQTANKKVKEVCRVLERAIDLLINRTLVYGLLTGVLALIYIIVILSMQLLFHGFIEGNSISLVVSTLLTVALFHPLRSRIQRLIDRRFYRSKYDATRILAAFSATLRNELDLNQLREQLIQVVEETMQPTNISLWIRPPERHKLEEHHLLATAKDGQ